MAADTLIRGYARTPGGQIHYAEAGEGPPLILLSESPRTHRQFLRLLPLLARHFRAIAIDTPGYGNSDPPPQPVTIRGVTGCLVDFLDARGFDRVDVLGIHTGNKLASCLAADFSQRVGKLVLVGHTHSIIPEWEARNAAIQPIFDTYLPHYATSPDGAHLVRAWTAAQANVHDYWWTPKLLFGRSVEPADVENVEARVIDYLLGWRNTVAVYQAVFDFDLEDAYKRITAPTLVLELLTPQEMHYGVQAERIAKLMKNAKATAIDSSYLAALQEQPQEVASAVLPFLTERDARSNRPETR
jgi:pimeloyl-ACP methyl ester carboxylesterase